MTDAEFIAALAQRIKSLEEWLEEENISGRSIVEEWHPGATPEEIDRVMEAIYAIFDAEIDAKLAAEEAP
jgi:hypothetical protein